MNVHNQLLMNRLKASSAMQPIQSKPSSIQSLSNASNKNDFVSSLQSSIAALEESQVRSDQSIQGLITGEAENLHQVMIETSEAQISLELAVQLRNKCIEAMNEIKNMQF